jgi:uncharacterized membrane protein YhaH (DUF805 family)
MELGESVKRNLTTSAYAQFSGRASRSEYWWFFLGSFLIGIALGVIDAALGSAVLTSLFVLGIIIPSIALNVRRLHDTGRSGWYVLLSLIPLFGPLVLLVFYASQGDKRANAYGPVPK